MQDIKILYLFFKKKIIFENLLAGTLKLGCPSLRGPRLQPILAYKIIQPWVYGIMMYGHQNFSTILWQFHSMFSNILSIICTLFGFINLLRKYTLILH